ncbi:hypothetical protein CR513_24517, partial [Mucuna pruriens]
MIHSHRACNATETSWSSVIPQAFLTGITLFQSCNQNNHAQYQGFKEQYMTAILAPTSRFLGSHSYIYQ